MTLAERVAAFKASFPRHPAAWLWLTQEDGHDVAYGVWVIGSCYRNDTRFYGAFPRGLVHRVKALFPDVPRGDYPRQILHAFSGSLPPGSYVRLDLNPANRPDIVGSVYDADRLCPHRFGLVIADPPYSKADAVQYGTPMIDRRRAVAALAQVTRPGGHLVWLDTCWPMHRKTEWRTVGRILIQRSTNHRARVLSIFERTFHL